MQQVLASAKSHGALIVLGAVALLLPVAGWYFGSMQREEVLKAAGGMASELDALRRAGKVNITIDIPGSGPWTSSGDASEGLLNELRARVDEILAGTGGIDARAVEHNRGAHGPIRATRREGDIDLRNIPDSQRSVFPADFQEAIVQAYDSLVAEAGAGLPPDPELVRQQLAARRDRVIQGEFDLPAGATLNDEQKAKLQEKLTATRVAAYLDQARSLKFYADPAAIGAPAAATARMDVATYFTQEWALWIAEDLVGAVMAANEGSSSVLDAPVKHLIWIGTGPMLPAPKAGAPGIMDPGGGGDEATLPPMGPDFAASITGRRSTDKADVVRVDTSVILETERIPAFVDALAKQNFIAVLGARVSPVDAFAAANAGFLYGDKHCSRLDLALETVWLREWTCALMPDKVRAALKASCGAAPPVEDSSEANVDGAGFDGSTN